MPTYYKILLGYFLIAFTSCKSTVKDKAPLIAKDTTVENEKNNTLFVFVGEKLEFTELPSQGSFDAGYRAKYKILQRVYGNYPGDTIEFNAYSHKGIPGFSKYKNSLLFLSEDSGRYYQEKYQYIDVYMTKQGRWAGGYDQYDYTHEFNEGTTVKPEKIDFIERVVYPTIIKYDDGTQDTISYPEPYYKTIGDSAIAVYGNYVEELFRLKKEGVLTARQLFGNRQIETPELKLEEVTKPSSKKK
jgi:hypothetical protein